MDSYNRGRRWCSRCPGLEQDWPNTGAASIPMIGYDQVSNTSLQFYPDGIQLTVQRAVRNRLLLTKK